MIYFRWKSKKKNKFYIFPDSQKTKHYSIYTTFQYFSILKVHFPTFSQQLPAHRLNSFFAGVYLYSLSCGQNAVTHCGTSIFPDSCRAVTIINLLLGSNIALGQEWVLSSYAVCISTAAQNSRENAKIKYLTAIYIYGNIFRGEKPAFSAQFRGSGARSRCEGRSSSCHHIGDHTWIMPGSCRNRCTAVEYALRALMATGSRRRSYIDI